MMHTLYLVFPHRKELDECRAQLIEMQEIERSKQNAAISETVQDMQTEIAQVLQCQACDGNNLDNNIHKLLLNHLQSL